MTITKSSYFLENEEFWFSHVGKWLPGETVLYREKNLFGDLADFSWLKVFFYGATGKLLSDPQVEMAGSMMTISSSFPDPRLWNNRVAALGGTTRTTASLALSAALAVSEAKVYGHGPIVDAFKLLVAAGEAKNQQVLKNFVIRRLKKEKVLPGFGRPVVRVDERVVPLLAKAKKLGFDDGKYVRLAFEIEKILMDSGYRLRMNIASLSAAIMADQGFTAKEHNLMFQLCFSAGILPCYIDACQKREGAFFPFRCERINYSGKPQREWPGE